MHNLPMDTEGAAGPFDRPPARRSGWSLLTVGVVTLFVATNISWGTSAAQTPVSPSTPSLVGELQRQSGGRATVALRPETGAATFVGGSPTDPLAAPTAAPPSNVARSFIDHYGPLFGVANPASDLTQLRVFTSESGNSAVRFQQRYLGLPVLAGELAVQVGADGSVLSTSGETLPAIAVDVTPQVSAIAAADVARSVAAKYDAVDINTVKASTPELWIYDPSLIGADGSPGTRLVWRVEARTDLGDVDRLVLVDAHTGTVALQFNQREDALVRSVCDNANNPSASPTCTSPVRNEGDPPVASGTGAADVNSAYDLTGVTYNFYSALGRNSVDNAGLPLKSSVRFCDNSNPCPYANAFWSGTQMVYGAGYAGADDVVAHELTHGVTQYTSQLLYYAESGAINESMSDVMGELVDLSSTVSGPDPPTDRWLMGEQLPGGAIRSMSDPTIYGDPDRMTSALYSGSSADSHGVHTNSSVGNKAAFLIADGGTFNGQTIVGLGTAKAALIYYELETTLLGPGSDYLDLFHLLPQACTNIVGTAGITAGDCGEVTKAVTATEMDKFPTTVGAHRSAPLCDAGTGQSGVLFSDNMETNSGNWTTNGGLWSYFTGSSQSGSRSLYAPDLSTVATATLAGTFTIAVPPGATFLRFDHSYQLDSDATHFYDGGVVEYSTDGGVNWFDAVALPGPTINGYDGTLETIYSNPLGGRQAFSGVSPGYQTTRINLSTLSGHNVKLRFRLGSDNSIASTGWFIDDVVAYTCAKVPSAPSSVVAVSGDHSAALTWPAPPDGGSPITSYTITPFIGGVAQSPVSTPSAATSFTVTGLVSGNSDTFTVAAVNAVGAGPPSSQSNAVIPIPTVVSLVPARLLESRSGLSTVDGLFDGVGLRGGGSVTALRVVGRGGVAGDAVAVVLNVTVTEAQGAGFVTVFPCGGVPPTASSLNFVAGSTVANAVVVAVGAGGQVCLFTQTATHLVVDVNGYVPAGSGLVSLVPARLLESRSGLSTVDGLFDGVGLRGGGSVTALRVVGRGGVAGDAVAVVLNVTVTEAQGAGFVTVFPCGGVPPTASSLNFVAGSTVANAVVVAVGAGGQVCLFTQTATHLVVDVNGYVPAGSGLVSLVPARLLESRSGLSTVDGLFDGVGLRGGGSVTALRVVGRGGVAGDAVAVVLNVTVTEAQGAGFVTVFPCGGVPPTASSLNFVAGSTVANAVVVAVGAGGQVCLFTQTATHLLVDVNGYFPP